MLDGTHMAEKESLEQPVLSCLVRLMMWGPQKSSRHPRTWLDSLLLCSAQLGCPPTSRWLGVDSTVKAEWGVEEVSLHQAVPTGPFKDLDMHPTRKPNLWTQVTETINNQSVLAHKTPTPNKGA